jgi:hypothetical protein
MRFASAIVILNLIDALFTILYTSGNVAAEGNPLMQNVLAASPVIFVITKLSLVSLCVTLLWRYGHKNAAVLGLLGTTAMYVVLIGYHLSAVPLLIARL